MWLAAEAADVPKIKAAIQLHYGGLDERVNAGIPAYEAALKQANETYELYIYDGVKVNNMLVHGKGLYEIKSKI